MERPRSGPKPQQFQPDTHALTHVSEAKGKKAFSSDRSIDTAPWRRACGQSSWCAPVNMRAAVTPTPKPHWARPASLSLFALRLPNGYLCMRSPHLDDALNPRMRTHLGQGHQAAAGPDHGLQEGRGEGGAARQRDKEAEATTHGCLSGSVGKFWGYECAAMVVVMVAAWRRHGLEMVDAHGVGQAQQVEVKLDQWKIVPQRRITMARGRQPIEAAAWDVRAMQCKSGPPARPLSFPIWMLVTRTPGCHKAIRVRSPGRIYIELEPFSFRPACCACLHNRQPSL